MSTFSLPIVRVVRVVFRQLVEDFLAFRANAETLGVSGRNPYFPA
jgi:hypothetical protein